MVGNCPRRSGPNADRQINYEHDGRQNRKGDDPVFLNPAGQSDQGFGRSLPARVRRRVDHRRHHEGADTVNDQNNHHHQERRVGNGADNRTDHLGGAFGYADQVVKRAFQVGNVAHRKHQPFAVRRPAFERIGERHTVLQSVAPLGNGDRQRLARVFAVVGNGGVQHVERVHQRKAVAHQRRNFTIDFQPGGAGSHTNDFGVVNFDGVNFF